MNADPLKDQPLDLQQLHAVTVAVRGFLAHENGFKALCLADRAWAERTLADCDTWHPELLAAAHEMGRLRKALARALRSTRRSVLA